MIKKLLIILVLALTMGNASATYEQINNTLYIYNATEMRYSFYGSSGVLDLNCKNVLCDGGICTELLGLIASTEDYSLEYELNYAPNESIYYTTLITIKQEEISSTLYGLYKKVKRTLLIDSVEVATYNNTLIINSGAKSSFGFKTVDKTCTFGTKTITNTTLFFSELVMEEQYAQLENESGHVAMRFKTSNEYGEQYNELVLGGFTGIFLSVIKKMPFIGTSIYNVLHPVVTIIQYTIDFSFSFLNLIINDWWYALLLLECMCMFVASRKNGYVEIVSAYITTHVAIVTFVYHKIILPTVNLIIVILNTIKNMIQWW